MGKMRKLNTLPLYRDTYELLNTIVTYVNTFPKTYKYSVGSKLMDSALELMKTLSLCAIYGDLLYFGLYIIDFQLTKTLIRLCNENHIISLNQTTQLALRMEDIEELMKKIIEKPELVL